MFDNVIASPATPLLPATPLFLGVARSRVSLDGRLHEMKRSAEDSMLVLSLVGSKTI